MIDTEKQKLLEILSDKMDTLRCLSCNKYFPDPCEDCDFADVFNDVATFLLEKVAQAKEEAIEQFAKDVESKVIKPDEELPDDHEATVVCSCHNMKQINPALKRRNELRGEQRTALSELLEEWNKRK